MYFCIILRVDILGIYAYYHKSAFFIILLRRCMCVLRIFVIVIPIGCVVHVCVYHSMHMVFVFLLMCMHFCVSLWIMSCVYVCVSFNVYISYVFLVCTLLVIYVITCFIKCVRYVTLTCTTQVESYQRL